MGVGYSDGRGSDARAHRRCVLDKLAEVIVPFFDGGLFVAEGVGMRTQLGACSVWDALKAIAQESLLEDCRIMIEAGASRQQIQLTFDEVLLPRMQQWLYDTYDFIRASMEADATSVTKH